MSIIQCSFARPLWTSSAIMWTNQQASLQLPCWRQEATRRLPSDTRTQVSRSCCPAFEAGFNACHLLSCHQYQAAESLLQWPWVDDQTFILQRLFSVAPVTVVSGDTTDCGGNENDLHNDYICHSISAVLHSNPVHIDTGLPCSDSFHCVFILFVFPLPPQPLSPLRELHKSPVHLPLVAPSLSTAFAHPSSCCCSTLMGSSHALLTRWLADTTHCVGSACHGMCVVL